MVNHVMVATVKRMNPWFSSCLVSSNPLSWTFW